MGWVKGKGGWSKTGVVLADLPGQPPSGPRVTPNVGPAAGGTAVTITGSGFVGVNAVNFGGFAASNVVTVSPTQITCSTPANAAGVCDVEVRTLTDNIWAYGGFTYQ